MGRNRRTVFEPRQVKSIAEKYGYTEIPVKPQVSGYMLSFEHPSKRGCGGTDSEAGHVRIDVYFTTGKVTTSLNHHKAGKGQMIRENVDLAMVERIFSYPRYHSNTGYKRAGDQRQEEDGRPEPARHCELGERNEMRGTGCESSREKEAGCVQSPAG